MREDKPRVEHHKEDGGNADHKALFKGTQVEAIQVADHSASVRLSSRTQCQLTTPPRTSQVTWSPALGSNNGWPLGATLRISASKSSSRLVWSAGAVPLSVSFFPSLK